MVCQQERVSIIDVRRHAAVASRRRSPRPHWLYVAVAERQLAVLFVCMSTLFLLLLNSSLVGLFENVELEL